MRSPRWWRAPLAVVVVGLGPVARTHAIRLHVDWRVVVVAAVAVLAAAALEAVATGRRGRSTVQVAAIVIGAALAGAVAGGRVTGVWILATTAFGAWIVGSVRQARLPAFDVVVAGPVLAGTLVLAIRSREIEAPGRTAVLQILVLVVALAGSARPERVRHLLGRLPQVVRRAVSAALLGVVWVITALVPWLFDRAARFDPVASVSGRDGGWVARVDRPDDPSQLWFDDPRRVRPRLRARLHARAPFLLGVLVVVVALIASALTGAVQDEHQFRRGSAAMVALQAEPDHAEANAAQARMLADVWFSQWVGQELPDFRSRTLNVSDGRRVTAEPTGCAGPALDVWMFGGSTLFGVEEPDWATLPSLVARRAAAQGISLRIRNYGVLGDVAWQEARRLERALASGEHPDLVVLYDGWNDLQAAGSTDVRGRGGPTDFVGPMDGLQEPLLTDLGGLEAGRWRVARVPSPEHPQTPQVVSLATRQYARADRTARLLAQDAGSAYLHLHQPNLYTRSEVVEGDAAPIGEGAARVKAFRRHLPEGVVDLGGVFDGDPRAYFYDEIHVVRAGSRIVADALYDAIEPTLVARGARTGGQPCR